MAPTEVPISDPRKGVFRWAYRWTVSRLDRFIIGTVVLGAVLVLANASVSLPAHPSWQERAVNGLVSFGVALGVVLVGVVFFALFIAPYQQRNYLSNLTAPDAPPVIHQRLGQFVSYGDMLLLLVSMAAFTASVDGDDETQLEKVRERFSTWRREVIDYLDSLGRGDSAVFWNDLGIPPLDPPDFDVAQAPKSADLYLTIQRRLYRLVNIMDRVPQ